MFTSKEATEERIGAYAQALEKEKADYEARLARITAGQPDRLGDKAADLIKGRIADVDRELKTVRKQGSKDTKAE